MLPANITSLSRAAICSIPTRREAVVGSFVAQKMGLKPGDTFHPYHGLIFNEQDQHSETYVVAGVLKPSNTPSDRVIWIPLEGIQKMKGHDPKAATDVSAVLVKLKGGGAVGFRMDMMYNKQGNRLTFAWPIATTMAELFDKIGWFDKVLALVSYLVALVATASILASIYNSMNERRREIAILRALGAHRRIIFSAILTGSGRYFGFGHGGGFSCLCGHHDGCGEGHSRSNRDRLGSLPVQRRHALGAGGIDLSRGPGRHCSSHESLSN